MIHRPAGFGIRYEWREGSVPPPDHFEFTIRLGPGRHGTVAFMPDYPMYYPPVWREAFDVEPETLDRLFVLMAERDLFEASWTEDDETVGGSLEWMEVTSDSGTTLVPGGIREAHVVADLYEAIYGTVPARIWDVMRDRQRAYQAAHSAGRGGSPATGGA